MRHRSWQTRGFTLIELLITMTILCMMMLLLTQVVVGVQKLMKISSATARIYENSRLAFDLLERDFRCTLTSSLPGKQIGFYVGSPQLDPPDASNCLQACFVSSIDPDPQAKCPLSELSYKFHVDTTTVDPAIPPYTLARQQVSDVDAHNWNFCGRPANWYTNNLVDPHLAPFEPIIGGVSEFSLAFFDRNDVRIVAGTELTELPARVEISMTLFDEDLVNAPPAVRWRTARTFTKIMYLGDMMSQ